MELCEKYKISAEDFVDQWSSFTVTNKYDITPTKDLLNIMERKDLKINQVLDNVNYTDYTPTTPKFSSGNFRKEKQMYPFVFLKKKNVFL